MENPFQKFATPAEEENPFAQFAQPQQDNFFSQFVKPQEPVATTTTEQAPLATVEAPAVAPAAEPAAATPEEKGFISNITGSVPKSWLNLKQAMVNMTLPDLIALKEASQNKYGVNYEDASEKQRDEFLKRDEAIAEKLATLALYGAEAKALDKQYGLTPIKQRFEELRKTPEYESAGTFEQFKRIGSVLLDNPASIPAYLATVTLETLPTSLATIAPAIATRYAGFSPNVAATVGGLGSYMTEFGGNYMDLRQNGMPHEEAWEKAGIKSGIIGLLDAASFKSAGAAAEKIFGQAQKAAIANGIKVASKEAAKQAGYGGGGEYLGTEAINEKVDPIAVLEEMAAEVAGAPAKAVSTYRSSLQGAPEAAPKVEPTVEPAAETTEATPTTGFDEYGYLDDPEYKELDNKFEIAAAEHDKLVEISDSFEEGTPEKNKARKEASDYFQKNVNPLIERRTEIRDEWAKQAPEAQPTAEAVAEEKPLTDENVIWLDQQAAAPEAPAIPEAAAPAEPNKIIVPPSDFQDNQAIFDALNIKPGLEEINEKIARAEPTLAEENIPAVVEQARVEPTLGEAAAPAKTVKANRVPELQQAAEQLQRGEITAADYDALVEEYKPIRPYAEVPTPTPVDVIADKINKDKVDLIQPEIPEGTRVGTRLDLPSATRGAQVVSIHEPRTESKAGPIVGYDNSAVLTDVTFGIGSTEKTALKIAAGKSKEALQTMEGSYVKSTPEEAYARAQEAMSDPAWTQVSFDPIRHSYFYDMQTGQPVIGASEVIQIGKFVIAKDVEYGDKGSFLYDIPTERKATESIEQVSPEQIREENIARYAGLKQRLSAIQRRFVEGRSKQFDAENYKDLYKVAEDLKDEIRFTKQAKTTPADFLARAAQELAKGNITQDVFDVVNQVYQKNPDLLNGIRLSVKAGPRGTAGQFLPTVRIVRLFKQTEGTSSPSTIRHELVHSLEQMMPPDAQAALVDAWGKALLKATQKAKTNQEKKFFVNVGKFIEKPNQETMEEAVGSIPDYSYYQYINPSEFWAVNAEKLMASYLGGAWQRFKASVKALFEALKNVFGFDNNSAIYKTFNSVINADSKRTSPMLVDYVNIVGEALSAYNIPKNFKGQPAPAATFTAPEETGKNEFVRKYVNNQVYLEKTLEKIRETNQPIPEQLEASLKEKLANSRASYQHKQFKSQEVDPILKEMKRLKISDDQLSEFLLAAHAEERNNYIASINPSLPDGGSSMDNKEAQDYMASLSPKRKAELQSVADRVYKIIDGTRDLYVANGDHKPATVKGWRNLFQNYVPLNRTEEDFSTGSFGFGGAGYGVSGAATKRTTGSKERQVKSILENVIHQRDTAIDRGERIRVGNALIGLSIQFPNPRFWLPVMPSAIKNQKAAAAQLAALGTDGAVINNLMSQPKVPVVNPKTGLVEYVANPAGLYGSNVFPTRINGENAYIVFNANDPAAKNMAEALNKMDSEEIGKALSTFGKATKAFSSLLTQYNPVWGLIVNLPRDILFSGTNVFTLPIKDKKFKFIMRIVPAILGSWRALRQERQGIPMEGKYAKAFEEMSEAGGRTLYRDSFVNMKKDGEYLEKEMAKLNRGNLKKVAYGIVNLLLTPKKETITLLRLIQACRTVGHRWIIKKRKTTWPAYLQKERLSYKVLQTGCTRSLMAHEIYTLLTVIISPLQLRVGATYSRIMFR